MKLIRSLTAFQAGVLFGTSLTALILAFAFWGQPPHKSIIISLSEKQSIAAGIQISSTLSQWWHWTVSGDSSGFYTLGLLCVGAIQAALFIWQLILFRMSLQDARQAADAAKMQAQLARASLISANRVWIKITKVEITSDLWINDLVTVTSVSVYFENIGNTPALKTAVNAWLMVQPMKELAGDYRLDNMHRLFCSNEETAQAWGFGGELVLYPGEKFPGKDGIEKHSVTANMPRRDFDRGVWQSKNVGGSYAGVHLGGCVFYSFPSDYSNIHRTSFLFAMNDLNGISLRIDTKNIPANGIILSHTTLRVKNYFD